MIFLFLLLASSWVSPTSLSTERDALEAELELASRDTLRYYLIVDTAQRRVDLKAGGNTLHSAGILSQSLSDSESVVTHRLVQTIRPGSRLPEQGRNRLAGRRLPLDFVGRLIEGPRKVDRLYFHPSFMIGSDRTPRPRGVPYVLLSGQDLKSLSSAVDTTTTAVVITGATP